MRTYFSTVIGGNPSPYICSCFRQGFVTFGIWTPGSQCRVSEGSFYRPISWRLVDSSSHGYFVLSKHFKLSLPRENNACPALDRGFTSQSFEFGEQSFKRNVRVRCYELTSGWQSTTKQPICICTLEKQVVDRLRMKFTELANGIDVGTRTS